MDLQEETIRLNWSGVSDLLRAGADVNAAGGEYGSAIQAAGQLGRDAILDLLIKHDADINTRNVGKRNPHGRTPLSLAAGSGHSLIVRQLLARDGINADLADNNGQTALSWASAIGESGSVVEELLERPDVDSDSKDINGRTPLSWAAGNGQRRVVELLLKRPNVNPNARDKNGRTALSWAAGNGCQNVAYFLVSREDVIPDLQDSNGRTPLSWATEAGKNEMVEILLNNPDVNPNSEDKGDRTPLSWAAEKGESAVTEILLQRPDIILNSVDKDGRTPLSWAAAEGQEEVVKLLLKRVEVDPNYEDRRGIPPLWWAANKGHDEVVELLLAAENINVNYKNKFGGTLLSWAAQFGRDKVVRLLMAKEGLTPDSLDNFGRTPLSWAAQNGRSAVIEFLLKRSDVKPDTVDDEHRTPLLWAAMNGHTAVVDLLLAKEGVNPNSADDIGRTPLLWALINGHGDVSRSLIKRDTTTLHSLVQEGERKLIERLLAAGYDVDRCDAGGTTALRLAIRRKHREMVELLLEHGAVTRGVMASEWLDIYGRQSANTVQLLEGDNGQKSIRFIKTGTLANLQTSLNQQRRLLVFPDSKCWPNELLVFGGVKNICPNEVQVSWTEINGHSTRFSVSSWFPAGQDSPQQQQYFNMPDWGESRIVWTIISPASPQSHPWQSVDHYSTLPNGWIPDDGIDFFHQFILHMEQRWMKLCDAADEHLKQSRLDQLRSEGKNPELMRRLAKDAQKWTELRSILQDHIDVAQKFIVEYCEPYNANQFPKDLQHSVNEFKVKTSRRIDQLDQTIRDLLQFEFAWASINESRISTRLGHNVMLFTYVSIFYLPLAFCAAIWAIPNINDSGTRNPFIITSVIVGLVTLFISFNLENITPLGWKLYQGWRAKLVKDMQHDTHLWRHRGDELEAINASSSFPSEWWLLGYMMYKPVDRFRALFTRRKKKEGAV